MATADIQQKNQDSTPAPVPVDPYEDCICLHCKEKLKGPGKSGGFHPASPTDPAEGGVHDECWEDFVYQNHPPCLACGEPVAELPGRFDGVGYEVATGLIHLKCLPAHVASTFRACVHCSQPCCKHGPYCGAIYELEGGAECHVECYEAYCIFLMGKNFQKSALKMIIKLQSAFRGKPLNPPPADANRSRENSLEKVHSMKPLRLTFGEQYGAPRDMKLATSSAAIAAKRKKNKKAFSPRTSKKKAHKEKQRSLVPAEKKEEDKRPAEAVTNDPPRRASLKDSAPDAKPARRPPASSKKGRGGANAVEEDEEVGLAVNGGDGSSFDPENEKGGGMGRGLNELGKMKSAKGLVIAESKCDNTQQSARKMTEDAELLPISSRAVSDADGPRPPKRDKPKREDMIPEAMPEPVGEGAVPETFVPPEHDFKHDEEKPADTPPDLPFQEAEVDDGGDRTTTEEQTLEELLSECAMHQLEEEPPVIQIAATTDGPPEPVQSPRSKEDKLARAKKTA